MVRKLEDEAQMPPAGLYGPNHTVNIIHRNGEFVGFRHGFKPPCECPECAQQFKSWLSMAQVGKKILAYTGVATDDEARALLASLRQTITADLEYLREQTTLNGNAILKPWNKKSTPSDRAQHLLLIDPKLYGHQWADARFSYDFCSIARSGLIGPLHPLVTQGQERRPYRKLFLLPYINIESLTSDSMRLLTLLHNRTKFSPAEWAPFDNSLLQKDWEIGTFETTYNGNCVVMHGPQAVLVLEAQQELLIFLRAIIEKLLTGLNREDNKPQSDNFFKAVEGGLKSSNEKDSVPTSVASVYLNQPFSAAPKFDIVEFTEIAQGQLNMHGDHLWLLQTDSAYVRRYSKVLIEGTFSEVLTKRNQYAGIVNYLMEAAVYFWSWEGIFEEVQKLQKLQAEIGTDINDGKSLHPEYEHKLGTLEVLLTDQLHRRSDAISQILPHRPGCQDCWKLEWYQRLQSAGFAMNRKHPEISLPELFGTDRLDFCTAALVSDPWAEKHNKKPRHDYATLFAMLDEHLVDCHRKGDQKEINRLDEVLYAMFTDLSAIHQMLVMIQLQRPLARKLNIDQLKSSEDGKLWRYIARQFLEQGSWRTFTLLDNGDWIDNLLPENTENGRKRIEAEQHLASLFQDFVETPTPKGSRFTKAWLDQDASQRAALSKFWAAMRARHKPTLLRLGFGDSHIQADWKILSADQDPNHLAEIREERDEILTEIVTREAQKEAQKEAKKLLKSKGKSDIQTQWGPSGDNEQQRLDVGMSKLNIKRHGTTNQADKSSKDQMSVTTELGEHGIIVGVGVSKKSLSIFRAMFPGRSPEERSRSVDWDSFVSAMAEEPISFVARHKGGAAWGFEPSGKSKWLGRGKIVIHKPHPVEILDPIDMSTIGKRMAKWFKWGEETFEPRKKE